MLRRRLIARSLSLRLGLVSGAMRPHRSASLQSKLPRSHLLHTQIPCQSMASATFRNPAMLAPAWMFPFMPYFSAAEAQAA